MKKKLLITIFAALLILSGCKSSDPISEPTEEPPAAVTAEESLCAVLTEDAPFRDADTQSDMTLSQIPGSLGDDVTITITQFAVLDLDSDGADEIILWEKVNSDEYYGYKVLRFEDGAVTGYSFYYRGFNSIKTDGTFRFSNSASNSGFATVSFEGDEYSLNKITHCDTGPISGNIIYIVDGKNSTEEEFHAAMAAQDEKEDILWQEFTNENILAELDS